MGNGGVCNCQLYRLFRWTPCQKMGDGNDFGKFADPLADKIITTTAIIYLVQMGLCHPIVLIVIIAREFAVSGVRMVAAGAPGEK